MVGAAVSLQSPGGGAMSVGVSTGCNSAGTTGTVSNVVILCGGSNVTLSESINGQSATITIIGGAGAGASFDGGVSSGGNTLGTTGTVSKEIVFVGGSNITLSQSSIAGGSATITIIGGAGAGASFDGGVSNLGNTLGTTGTVSNEILFVGGSNITLSQSINANSATITVNALSQSQQTQNIIRDVIISGNTSGTTANITSGTLVLAGGAGLILFQNANSITFSVSSHYSAGVSNLGNTSGTTGTVGDLLVLAGGNNITLSQSVNLQSATITISSPNMLSGGISNLGNTAGTSGAASELLILAGGSNITLSQSIDAASSVATVTIIGQSQSLQTQSIVRNVVISGNTSGTTANITSGTLTLAGGNSITLSQVGNAITISGASTSQSVQTQNVVDITLSGNTSGTLALVSSGTLTLAGGNNITLSQAGGNAITISAFNQSIQTQSIIRDVLISGNTSGTTADITSGTLTLVGGQSITLSQVGNAITISGASTSQSIQTQSIIRDVLISGNTSGTTADITSGTLTLAGGNNITLSQVGNAITISGGTAAGATFSAGVSNLGNTAGTTGVVTNLLVFAGGSNITVSQSANAGSATITINAATVAGGSFSAGVSNIGNTSGSTGTVSQQLVLAGGNNITLSQSTNGNSATVTISAFNQTVQTQNVVDITLSGNTSGTLALISSGTLTLAGGNNITLSQAGGNAVTISAASQSIQTQSIIRDVNISGNTSGTTADITSGTLILAGGNSITLSQNGNSVTISGATTSQSVQTQNVVDVTLSGNTTGTLALVSSGTLTLAGGNNITLSQAGGNAITISGASQSIQTQSIINDINIIGNTSGTTADITSGTFFLAGGNGIILSQNGQSVTISGHELTAGISAGIGNTSGTTGLVHDRLVLAGGNNITLSQSVNLQSATLTISSPNMFSAGVSTGGNTLGTTGAVSQFIDFVGGNNVTLSQSTNGGSATITISVPSQTVQTQSIIMDVIISGNTSGTTADITSGTLILVGGNRITLSQVGNAVTISGPALGGSTHQHVIDGNTSGTTTIMSSGILTLAGGNNITLSQVGNAVTISAFNQSVQTQNVVDITLSGNTSGTLTLVSSGTLTLAGGQSITLSQVGNAVTISGASTSQSVQTQNLFDLTLSGNTTGTLALVSSGTLTLAGGNSITLSQVGNAITISGASTSQSVQTQSIVRGVVIGGNTSGTTASITSGTLTLAGGNNITISQAGGNAITISAPEIPDFGVSNVGNTSGVTGTVNAQLILAGGNNITVSQSTNGQLATVTISAARGIILVSNSLVTASAQVLSFTGANVTDHAYTFHMYISNPLNASPVYSVMYNGVSAGITRDYMVGRVGTVTATSDNNPIAFNLSASEEAHHIIHMMLHTTPVRMYAIGNEATLGINQGAIRQTGTGATNVTAIVISANAANAIGPNSRIIWYKHG